MPRYSLIGLLLIATAGSSLAADLRYWIEPCKAPRLVDRRGGSSCKADDPALAVWAFDAWQKASGGKLHLKEIKDRLTANIRVHWASAEDGQYGETRPFQEGGLTGYDVYVRPDTSAMGPEIANAAKKDELLRDAIVYLTCLHESGHALGLSHTDAFADIMYTFTFGGDIPEYFNRYRRQLQVRKDIAEHSGISAQDQARLMKVLR